MTETMHTPTTARRGLLAGAAALVVTAAQAAAPLALTPDPDAALHEAVAEVRAADEAIAEHLLRDPPEDAPPAVHAADDDLTSRQNGRWRDGLEALAEIEPKTVAGMVAKAQATIIAFDRNVPTLIGDTVEDVAEDHIWLAYQTAHNVLSLAGAEPWPAHPAKAEFVRRHEARMREGVADVGPRPASISPAALDTIEAHETAAATCRSMIATATDLLQQHETRLAELRCARTAPEQPHLRLVSSTED